jgi:hypothetical protein
MASARQGIQKSVVRSRPGQSQILGEFFDGNDGLAQDALQGFRQQSAMVGHGDVDVAFAQSDVRAVLPGDGEAESPQGLDRFGAGDVAREFHAEATTGSLTKCNRMLEGILALSK